MFVKKSPINISIYVTKNLQNLALKNVLKNSQLGYIKVMKKLALTFSLLVWTLSPSLLFAVGSDNYELRDYGFGAGGGSGSSDNYKINAVTGEVEYGQPGSDNYKIGAGLNFVQQANVPAAPTVSNPANYYNKLLIVIDTANNPSDTLYAIAASTDNFASNIQYVQNDNTLGPALGLEDFQSYVSWGSGSGFNAIGLTPGTTYSFKVAALQGDFTQTGFGPSASASTISPTLSFDIDVASSNSESSPPYTLNIGTLTPSTVTTSSDKVWVDLTTNATAGGMVFVYGANSGLSSSVASATITTATADLTGATSGYGARSNTVSETSGGPMQAVSPYNGASNNVGLLDTNKRLIFDSSGSPVSSGRTSFELKAKSSNITPAATDYSDLITVIAVGSF